MADQLGDRVRETRKRYGMSAAELARRIHITRQQLYMIERNKTLDPGVLTVKAIAETLRVGVDYLLGMDEDTERMPAMAS